MTQFAITFAVAAILWVGWKLLFGPMKAPPGWDRAPDDWTVDEAIRVMRDENEDARG